MKFIVLEPQLDFNDPEENFTFSFEENKLRLSFLDWQNIKHTFEFEAIYAFSYKIFEEGTRNLPEAKFLQLCDTEELEQISRTDIMPAEDALKHYVISTNEDEYFEIISEGYKLIR